MKYFLILNPRSRSGKAARLHQHILSEFGKNGTSFDYSFVHSFDSIRRQSEFANLKGYDKVIAVGGDGTINAVISGCFDPSGKRISAAGMGVIYTGTSPDFCKSYGISLNLEKAIQTCIHGKSRKIRIGKIVLNNQNQQEETRYFACCANIGLGAQIARMANANRKYLGDTAGTLTAVLSSLMNHKPASITLHADNETRNFDDLLNIFIGRTRFIASGIKTDHSMDDNDDRFYTITVRNPGLLQIPSLLRQVYSGKIKSNQYLQRSFGQVFLLSSSHPTEVEFDGDPAGYLPCSIELAPDPLELMVTGD